MYNTDDFQVLSRSGKPIRVSSLTEEEAKQELCTAMQWIDALSEQVADLQGFLVSWSLGAAAPKVPPGKDKV